MMIGGRFSRAVSTRLLSEKVTARITSNRQTIALLNYRCSASRADPGGGQVLSPTSNRFKNFQKFAECFKAGVSRILPFYTHFAVSRFAKIYQCACSSRRLNPAGCILSLTASVGAILTELSCCSVQRLDVTVSNDHRRQQQQQQQLLQ